MSDVTVRTGQAWQNKLSGGRVIVVGPVHSAAVWIRDAVGVGPVRVMSHELLRADWKLVGKVECSGGAT